MPIPQNKLASLSTYLAKHGEPIPALPAINDAPVLRSICVVPAFDESPEQLIAMAAVSSEHAHALVLVLNAPENASAEALARTQACRDTLIEQLALDQISEALWQSQGQGQNDTPIWLLDYCSQGRLLNPKQGVGLARKLGLDFALQLCVAQLERKGRLPAWLMSCDADVSLPSGYFDIAAPTAAEVACVYPVVHQPEAGLEQAMALYDLRLDYYVEQLARVGSPYAFHTLGSAIAVTPLAYAQVRGMPKHAAGEDFYLLNKLAKLNSFRFQGDGDGDGDRGREGDDKNSGSGIRALSQPVLSVAGRTSERVPFGTGPALADILSLESALRDYHFYHPKCFQYLGDVLALARRFKGHQLEQFEHEVGIVNPYASARLCEILRELGIAKFFDHFAKHAHKQDFWPQFCIWFDGFRTLRLLNELRERDCLSANLQCLAQQSNLLSDDLNARIARILETANAENNVKASQ